MHNHTDILYTRDSERQTDRQRHTETDGQVVREETETETKVDI